MKKELKIYINDYKTIEEKLGKLGAKFIIELNVIDTYFKQPEGLVLKISQDERGSFSVKLKANKGGFGIISNDSIKDLKKTFKVFESKYGISCVLKKKKRVWQFENYKISINLFNDIGQFLIVEGEQVITEIITDKLGIKNPKYLTISFDKLKEQLI